MTWMPLEVYNQLISQQQTGQNTQNHPANQRNYSVPNNWNMVNSYMPTKCSRESTHRLSFAESDYLEHQFNTNNLHDPKKCQEIADEMGLTANRVLNWLRNRQTRKKKSKKIRDEKSKKGDNDNPDDGDDDDESSSPDTTVSSTTTASGKSTDDEDDGQPLACTSPFQNLMISDLFS